MEYSILKLQRLVISDNRSVRLYDLKGKQLYDNVPSKKMFDELAYIHPPVTMVGESFDSVVQIYLNNF